MGKARDEVNAVLTTVTELGNAGRYDEALDLARELAQRLSEDSRVVGVLGATLYRAERLEEARPVLVKATRLAPRAELPSLVLFHCLWDLGDTRSALAEVARFLSTKDSEEFQNTLAELGYRYDRTQGAVIELDAEE